VCVLDGSTVQANLFLLSRHLIALSRHLIATKEGSMKVGILGSGDVGKSLTNGFLRHGHEVTVGTRDPKSIADWPKTMRGVKTGAYADAAQFGELVVLAVKGTVVSDVLRAAKAENLKGKVVIDATNPIADQPPVNGVLTFTTSPNESSMERLQRELPGARFVKAFNSVGSALMVNPELPGGPPTMFICGNDDAAKASVKKVLDQFGWDTADMGKAEAARAIEPLCVLWCIPGFTKDEWTHAFKLLRQK
jgi:predicted dinucleotide-binding enzyme